MPPRSRAATAAKPDEAEEPAGQEETMAPAPVPRAGATSNESPPLPPNAQAGAARALGMLDELQDALAGGDPELAHQIAGRAKAELGRYVPGDMIDTGRAEAAHVVATEVR